MNGTSKNKGYPSLFLAGFLGYGEGTLADKVYHYWGFSIRRDLLKHLREEGYEVYDPHLGPFNSAWDRSCILWAYLMGGTVDFGKVHSEKYGHARYGRTYPGILKDWGQEGPHEKINIIGHSFGGPLLKMFAELVYNGSDEEIAGTAAEEGEAPEDPHHHDTLRRHERHDARRPVRRTGHEGCHLGHSHAGRHDRRQFHHEGLRPVF